MSDRGGSSSILINVTFINNSASDGGGMFSEDSTPTLSNVTFSNNSAIYRGGAIINFGYLNSPTLTNVTFAGNTAGQGGGMVNEYASSATLTNCILWGDTPEEIYIYAGSLRAKH
jgi:predicted outer membrane repeat protein